MSDEQNAGLPPAEDPTPAPHPVDADALREAVIEVLKTCYDPEIPVNIYELGLIYNVHVTDDGVVEVKMTLTSPMCPVAGSLPPEVQSKIRGIAGVTDARVEVVWDPPWDMSKMSEAARLQLNLM
jgi:FeS assembly SUF system protein